MFIYQFRLRSTAITFIFQNLVKETPKKLIWKMTSCAYSTSGAISQTNIKALVWNWVCLFYIRSHNTYLPVFWKFWKKMFFQKFFWKNRFFYFWGSKTQNFENPRWPSFREFDLHSVGAYGLPFPLLPDFIRFFKQLPLFHPKWHNMTSSKLNFLKKFWTNFDQIFSKDVELML